MAKRASEIPSTRILAGSVNPLGATSTLLRLSIITVRIVLSELLSCAGTVFCIHCLFLRFITAESDFERVVGLLILSAYRPIQCGGNCDSANTSRLGSYYLFTDHCNVEKNVLWLHLWAGFPLSVYELMLMWGNLLPSYVSH